MANNIISSITSAMDSKISALKSIPNTLISKVRSAGSVISNRLNNLLSDLMKKPSDKNDYIKIGKIYISKKTFVIGSLLIIAVVVLFVKYFYPWADGNLWTANVRINSSKYYSITGKKVRVRDQMGMVIYEGEMSNGTITGKGTQYDSEGRLVYEGEFENGNYSNQGKLYNSEGVLIYKGGFSQNLYQGEGELYDNTGALIYKGSFDAGLRSGIGIEYNPITGKKIYYGSFANDVREGKGTVFTDDGQYKLYEGDFVGGNYSGSGKLYENGILKYVGAFENGLYEGDGTLYDIETSKIVYKGAFAAGLYEGDGALYDPKTSKLLYQGSFVAGKKSGEGSTFDRLGAISFNGEFKDDNINYLNYIGSPLEEVSEQFGKESYRDTTNDSKLILTYLSLDMSIVFKSDEDKGKYVCEKMITGNKGTFSGLKSTSSKEDIINVMGNPYSSVDYSFAKYYDTVFKKLSIDLNSATKVPSDKFLMDGYYVRFYYNKNRTEYFAIEISSL